MPAYDSGFKIAARVSGAGLSRMAGVTCQRCDAIGDTLQTTTERLADRAFRAQDGKEKFVIYLEAYTEWVESAPWSVLAKSGLLSERERLPTCSLLFILTPRGYQPQQQHFRLAVKGKPTQEVWFEEVCLWQQRPQAWWEQHPGVMTLYPLCQHGQTATQAIRHASAAIQRQALDHHIRADLLTTLGIFGKLQDRTLDVVALIGRELMRDSPFYDELLEEGGQIQARKAVLQVLQLRFGDEAVAEFTDSLNGIVHKEQLEALHKIAVTCRRLSQFRKAWPKP